jgi:4-amino-4-deoxy-L-arabinose transferase-like glycosyltransferase
VAYQSGARGRPSAPLALAVVTAVALVLFGIRLTGPPNWLDNEYRIGASVLDAIRAGNWICPQDALGNTDKPPLLTWLVALAALPSGRVTLFTLYLPTALATLAVAWLVFAVGRREWSARAGFLAALACLLSEVGTSQIATARWDGLFALTVMLTAIAAFDAWLIGGRWIWFWLAAAAATLTKGPLGVLLGGLGLLAAVWERRSGTPAPIRGRQLPGLGLYLTIVVGWFVLAYLRVGPHLVDNMLGRELLGHAIEHAPGRRFTKPAQWFLGNFAPWSIVALAGLVRICRAPAAGDRERRFERFLFCWFVGGMLIFSVSPHNAARLILPLIPAAALIAGRELATLTARVADATLALACAGTIAAALGISFLVYHHLAARDAKVRKTRAMQELADVVQRSVGRNFPLTYVDAPLALPLLLDTVRPPVSFDQAAFLLAGDAAAFAVVENDARLRKALGPRAALYEVAAAALDGRPWLRVVANRPRLAQTDPTSTFLGPVLVRMTALDLDSDSVGGTIAFKRRGPDAAAVLVNVGTVPRSLRVRFLDAGGRFVERTLDAGDAWQLQGPAVPAVDPAPERR